ncbi:hypothetical protein AUJ46_00740 [Candidatus Peregrinibacteria bacterium CG1_02_54_53]|nr:MAG: hypothetical protein AUJ46_00740 [Candidatus Peregrinibacteria bacterium CG1_02_54_53]
MLEDVHHECGVAGAMHPAEGHDVVELVAAMTRNLEHRGGVAAGIAVPQKEEFRVIKGSGHAASVLTSRRVHKLSGQSALGHTRYATAGSEDRALAQPEEQQSANPDERFVFGWNGNVTNVDQLRRDEVLRGASLRTTGDTEPLKMQILRGIQRHTSANLAAVFADIERAVDGSFNIAMLLQDGTLAAYRDRQGRHPLNYAVADDGCVLVASEDKAMRKAQPGVHPLPINPGELLIARRDGLQLQQVMEPDPRRCFFEWVYFSDGKSSFDGSHVGAARSASGRILALLDAIAPDGSSVVAVPDSARIAADAYAHQKKWPILPEGIVNLLPGQRTFTTGDPARTEKARKKYGINRDLLEGKSIVLVDDSMVRGTTMRELIQRLRTEGGAAQIHLRLACPPILSPCFYGIDFPEIRQLIARHNFNGALRSGTLPPEVLKIIAARLGVDSIQFLPVEAIPLAIGCEMRSLCMACVTGKYPTSCGQQRAEIAEGSQLPTRRN